MKKKGPETDNNKKINKTKLKKDKDKEKLNKKIKLNIEENEKSNAYEEYRIEKIDLISQESEDDIETKMRKLIEIKKKGGNLEDYNKNEINKIQFKKLNLNKFTSDIKKEENKNNSEDIKLNKIQNGLNNFLNFIKIKKENIKKNIFNDIKLHYKKNKEKEKIIKEENIIENINEPLLFLNKNSKGFNSSEEYKNHEEHKDDNQINDKNDMQYKLNKLIASINNLMIQDKKKLLNSIIRARKKRRTVKMGSTISKKNFRYDERKRTKKQTLIAHQKSKNVINEVEEEEISFDLDDPKYYDNFIEIERLGDIEKNTVNKSQLVEYDNFYKEQFFKNEVFNYDVSDIKDKEVEEINHEMNKLEAHRKLLAKRKEKDAQEKKGLDTTDLQKEIEKLEKEYIKAKTKEKPKLNLIMDNTEGLLKKGRLLGFYFTGVNKQDFPRFTMESSKEIGAKNIIDFKVLRKEEQARRYFDYYCCMEQRKKIYKGLVYVRFWCRFLVNNYIFDNFSLLIIILNTILILISDPTDANNIGNTSDNYFLYFYTFEAVLKIVTFTFISTEDAYLKDYWNILDFLVVLVGWVSFIIEKAINGTKITGLAGLRAFRILRPLKTVKRFKGLKKLVTALLASISHLGETTIVLVFFFLIFAIGGRQMWMGNFYRRCMNINYGYMYSTQEAEMMCSFDTDCEELNSYGVKYICAKGYLNPDSGAINFDDTIAGFITIFVMVTLEGWTNVFTYVSKTFKDKIYINPIIVFLYFHVFVFLGAFYLINLFLAVTNSEFEKIEADRKLLQEKKSFYRLLKETFDPKEKLKKEKKKKDKKKKEANNMKSDQALIDLYYKVKDEAYQITKNKRDIPLLYSTVKDIYIMSNHNPEELYLEEKKIDEEDTFLSKDIKRQQKEIDALIDEKRKEMKGIKKMEKDKLKKVNTLGSKYKSVKSQKSLKSEKSFKSSNSGIGKNTSTKNKFLRRNETSVENITKLVNKINREMVIESIENTQKQMKDRALNVNKRMKSSGSGLEEEKNALRRKIEKKAQKKEEMNKIKIEEDLPYEHEIRLKHEKIEKEKRDKKNQEKKEAKITKFRNIVSKRAIEHYKEEKLKELNQEQIGDDLTFLSDLSLSNLNQSFSQLRRVNSIKEESEKKYDSNHDSFIEGNNNIMITENKKLNQDIEEFEEKVNFKRPKTILSSILELKNDLEVQAKLEKMRKKFNINNFLKKQGRRGVNTKNIGRRRSFLRFLEYTTKPDDFEEFLDDYEKDINIKNEKKEKKIEEKKVPEKPQENNQIINTNNNNISEISEKKSETSNSIISDDKNSSLNELQYNNLMEFQNILEGAGRNENQEFKTLNNSNSFLSKDVQISIDENVSLGDINLIPQEIKEPVNLFSHELQKRNLNKNLEGNKFTQLLRKSIFDRNSVNTNINLTSNEQAKYFKRVNKLLNKNLYSDKIEPRGRNPGGLDVSHVETGKDYCAILNTENAGDLNLSSDNDLNNSNNNNLISVNNTSGMSGSIINFNQAKQRKTLSFSKLGQITENESATKISKRNPKGGDYINKNTFQQSNKKKAYKFKAKSIEKNLDKYPVENSNKDLIKEVNRPYTDPLTIKQESITDNLRGTKYYMNYLYNIIDKDLKVKDTFRVGHWANQILGKKDKFFKKKPLPESVEAFFVFNDKKLNLKKYKYLHHKDFEYSEQECAYLTHNLKYLPKSILETMPKRLRDFGKFASGKEINLGTLGIHPDGMNITNNIKSQNIKTDTRSGKTYSTNIKNKSNLISSSAFIDHNKTLEQIRYKKGLHEKIYKKVDELNYRTLSSYFTEENKIYAQFIDEKKKEEAIKEIEARNNEKHNRLEVKEAIQKIDIYDLKTNSRRYILWSGPDVLCSKNEEDNRKKWNNIIDALEDFNMIIWTQNAAMQKLQKVRYAFYILATNDYFDYFILFVVLVNSVFMALDGNIFKPEIINNLNISNYVFNSIFFLEYIVKFIGLSPLVYYSDGFTYLDTVIIAFAILDMVMPSEVDDEQLGSKKSVSSQLSFLRVFRIFRVIRLTKILRRLKSMRLIIVSMKKALISVSYIVCILVMFILIFELLGMSLLSGNMHYQKFVEGFYTTYQILTLENWDGLLYELWPMNNLCFIYFVIWIFLGNYIIFNLFISVLLQSFGNDDENEVDDMTEDQIVENMYKLPDYLYIIKKAEEEHKIITSKDLKRLSDRNKDDEDEDEGENTKDTPTDDKNNNNNSNNNANTNNINKSKIISGSKTVSKSRMSNISRNASMISGGSESRIIDDDESNSSEDKYLGNHIERKMREWAKVNRLFKKNECERAMFILPQTNKFRIICLKLMSNKWFDRFILLMILASTARLILDTMISGFISVLTFDMLDLFFNLIFFIEAIIKICALGFVMDEGSYLRDNWNKIDIIIVICSIFDFVNLIEKYLMEKNQNSSLQFLKVLRLLRTLRPLRFISHNIQLKLIIISLFDSILPIINALLIVIVVYYIFSIVGISLFYDELHNCYSMNSDGSFSLATDSFDSSMADSEINNDKESISNFCSDKFNGIMDTGPAFKFSNIFTSFITSYVLSTQEGWPDIMNSYRIYGDVYGIFFIVYNLVVAYFFLNLFTGIMFRYFNEAYSKEQKLSKDDKKAPKYYDFLTQIYKAQSDYEVWVMPEKGSFRFYLREFADSSFLDNFIMGCIVLNMISMAMNYDTSDEKYDAALTYVNYIFTGIFIVECIIKLLAYFPVAYFHSGWNRFDFFVVVASIADLVIANIDGIDAKFLKSFQIIRVLRVLRVTRVLRLVKSLKGLEKLIQTLSWSISALANVFLLMLIIFCIFAILGCYFYDGIIYEKYKSKFKYINEFYNVDNFYNSFLLTFRCTTGESWHNIMMELAFVDLEVVSEAYAYIYMIISNFVNSIIMLNLFLMVTLQQYDEFTNKNYNPIEKFESFLTEFNNSWNKYSAPEDKGVRIKQGLVINFFMDFNWKKLNFPEKGKLEHIKKFVMNLKLRRDIDDNVYYLEVIYKVLINTMGTQVDRENPDNALILRTEKKVLDEVNETINYLMKRDKKQRNKKNLAIPYNPLTTHLYFKMSYQYIRTFINSYKENQHDFSQYNDENNDENDKDYIEDNNDDNEGNMESERPLNKGKNN